MARIHVLLQKGNFQMLILATIAVFLFFNPIASMELIDFQGSRVTLSAAQKVLFLESDLGTQLKDDIQEGRRVDLSAMPHVKIAGASILKVLDYVGNLQLLTSQDFNPEEAELLEAGNLLGVAPSEVLFHLANRVWPHLARHRMSLLSKTEHEKATLRNIAKPYLYSPRHILAAFKKKDSPVPVASFCVPGLLGGFNVDFSPKIALSNYCLGSLDGLKECIDYISGNRCASPIVAINLSSNLLTEFDIGLFTHLEDVRNLACIWIEYNNIHKITATKRANPTTRLSHISFIGNPVDTIDDSLYQFAKSYRSRGLHMEIIMHSELSHAEKDLVRHQWYLATNTLVEQYLRFCNPEKLGLGAGLAIFAGGGVAAILTPATGLQAAAFLPLGFSLACLSYVMLNYRYLPRLAYYLARKTHPELETTEFNHERPFGNTWLRDEAKPRMKIS